MRQMVRKSNKNSRMHARTNNCQTTDIWWRRRYILDLQYKKTLKNHN